MSGPNCSYASCMMVDCIGTISTIRSTIRNPTLPSLRHCPHSWNRNCFVAFQLACATSGYPLPCPLTLVVPVRDRFRVAWFVADEIGGWKRMRSVVERRSCIVSTRIRNAVANTTTDPISQTCGAKGSVPRRRRTASAEAR